MQLKVKAVTQVDEFFLLKEQWEALLDRSSVDKLFLSWQWMYSWWQIWGEKLGLKLMILQAYEGEDLVGLAPLYMGDTSFKGFPLKSLQFIGNAWGIIATVRTEYMEFIAPENKQDIVCEVFLKHISNLDGWDELVLCDVPKTSVTYKYVELLQKKYHWYQPEKKTDYGVKVDSRGDFEEYLSLIGRNTRLKLYNRRKYLQGLKDVEIKTAGEDEVDEYLSILNDFHTQRWGKPCFRAPALDFHSALIKSLNKRQAYKLSCIYIDSKPVSLLYDLSAGDVSYNIQAGYVENYDKKLSLGTLHLGFAIEQAFDDEAVTAFDMLIGAGKNEFYKDRYKGETVEFETLRVVRNNTLKTYLIIYYLLPDSVKNTLSIIARKLKSII